MIRRISMSPICMVLLFLNWVCILCLITPAVVNFWRGTWYILDLFVFPDDKVLSAQMTLAASFGAAFMIMLVEDYLKEFLNERRAKRVLYLVLFYPLAFIVVTSWRGLWMMLDLYTTTGLTSACISHAVGFLVILFAKASSSIIAIPGFCISERHIDDLSQSILVTKRCLKNRTSCCDIATRIANSFVTVIIIGSAVISYWRGTWLVIVATMSKPNDELTSSLVFICVGYTVFTICYCVSEFLSTRMVSKLTPPYSLLSRAMEQVFVYILGFGVVASWVGIWHLMDLFLLPGRHTASALVGHFAGIAVLYLLQASLNLISPPATCRVLHNEKLDGLDLGYYLKRSLPQEKNNEKTKSTNRGETTAQSYGTVRNSVHGNIYMPVSSL